MRRNAPCLLRPTDIGRKNQMNKSQTIKTSCLSCNSDTNHTVLFRVQENSGSVDYRVFSDYEVVECCGCNTKSFRKVVTWAEEPQQDEFGDGYYPQDIYVYPSILKGHKPISDLDFIPSLVKSIYLQSLNAIKNEDNILAGIGLRSTIEAICNHENILGRTLEQRIDKLSRSGFISKSDTDRLHAIRFLGNDAAHEIQSADKKGLLVALRIVEHLIVSLYLLDRSASGVLDTLIKDYSQFEIVLNMKLEAQTKNQELPLTKILGRDARRFHTYLKGHETELISKIKSGDYIKLKIGKFDSYSGSTEKVQHFSTP